MPASLQDDALAYIAQRAPGHVPDAHSVNGVMAFLAQNPSMRPSYSGPPGYTQDDRASMDALVDQVMQQSDAAPTSARVASGASQQGLEPPMPGRKPGSGPAEQPGLVDDVPGASTSMSYHSRPVDDGLPLSFGAPRVGQAEPEVDDERDLDMPWFIPVVGAGAAGAAEYMGQAPRPPFGPDQSMYPNSGGNLPQLPPPADGPDLIDEVMGRGPNSFGPYSGGAQYELGAWPDADAAGNVYLGPPVAPQGGPVAPQALSRPPSMLALPSPDLPPFYGRLAGPVDSSRSAIAQEAARGRRRPEPMDTGVQRYIGGPMTFPPMPGAQAQPNIADILRARRLMSLTGAL